MKLNLPVTQKEYMLRDGVLMSVLKFTLFTLSPVLLWRLLNRRPPEAAR